MIHVMLRSNPKTSKVPPYEVEYVAGEVVRDASKYEANYNIMAATMIA